MRWFLRIGALTAAGLFSGCTGMAVNAVADALSKEGGSFAREEDPELVRDAIPFGLKTMESLLDQEPEHQGLLLALCRGFTQYAFAFLQQEADYLEAKDFEAAARLRVRAYQMYRRAKGYGVRGLAIGQEDFEARLLKTPEAALSDLDEDAVPLLLWTAQAWAAGVSINKDDAELGSGLDVVDALARRALALDESFGEGAIHDFLVSWEGGRPEAAGGSPTRAKEHLDRSLALSQGERLGPLVSYAESICVTQQDRAQFEALLKQVLAFDPAKAPRYGLANRLSQRRATWLLAHADDLFVE